MNDPKHNEWVRYEVPAYASVLIDDFLPHVVSYLRQLSLAVSSVQPICDLGVEVHGSASATIAVDEEAAETPSTGALSFPTILAVKGKDQSGEMERVNENHQLHEDAHSLDV